MTTQQHDHLRLVRPQGPRAPRHKAHNAVSTSRRTTKTDCVEMADAMTGFFVRAAREPGWVERLVENRECLDDSLTLAMIVAVNAKVIEASVQRIYNPTLRLIAGGDGQGGAA